MEKVVYLLEVDKPAESLLDFVQSELLAPIQAVGGQAIHFAIVDEAVAPAASKAVASKLSAFNIYLSFWLPTALQLDSWMSGAEQQSFDELLKRAGCRVRRYVVTESTVLDVMSKLDDNSSGVVRLPGWQQVVSLNIPANLAREQWLATWLYSHADIACDTQSTFGYIHNIVQRTLADTERDIDAIVTENFPDAAMTSDEAFYDAVGDSKRLEKHLREMMESCARFIDNSTITVVPMSAYAVV